jgi:hypothetical protein
VPYIKKSIIFELKYFLYAKATHTVHHTSATTGSWFGNGQPIYKREQGVTATIQL